MEELKKLEFKKIDGTHIENVEQYVKNWIKENPHGTITLGCDSQVHGRRIKFSVVICLHYIDKQGVGHGAHVIAADVWEKRMNKTSIEEMPSKLWREAEYVLVAAEMVDGKDEAFKKYITVHLDYNEEPGEAMQNKSNVLFASGIGYINAFGYHAVGKPFSWASTHTADAYCR